MENNLKLEHVEEKLIVLREQKVLMDYDVAAIYGVETKRINEAVKNNPEKFPLGYVFEISEEELLFLRSKFSTAKVNMKRYMPKAFTEKGLYMLATILKSEKATSTTIVIIETFAKLRKFTRTLSQFYENPDEVHKQKLTKNGNGLFTQILSDDLKLSGTETSIELNFSVLKIKHTIKRK